MGVRADMTASWLAQMGWETYVLEGGYDRALEVGPRRLCRSPILRTATGVPMRAPTSLRARCRPIRLGIGLVEQLRRDATHGFFVI